MSGWLWSFPGEMMHDWKYRDVAGLSKWRKELIVVVVRCCGSLIFKHNSCSPETWVTSDSTHTFTHKHIQTMQQRQVKITTECQTFKVKRITARYSCNHNKQLKTPIRSDHLITHFLLWFQKPAATLCQNFNASLFERFLLDCTCQGLYIESNTFECLHDVKCSTLFI